MTCISIANNQKTKRIENDEDEEAKEILNPSKSFKMDSFSKGWWSRKTKFEKVAMSCLSLLFSALFVFLSLYYITYYICSSSNSQSIPTSFSSSSSFLLDPMSKRFQMDNESRQSETLESRSLEILEEKLDKITQTFVSRFPRSPYFEAPNSIPLPLRRYKDGNLTNEEKIDEIFGSFDGDGNNEANPWELHDWINWVDKIVHNSQLEDKWSSLSKSNSELLSWTDYLTQNYPHGVKDGRSLRSLRKNERRWKMADKNEDNYLSKREFKHFLFPQLNSRAEGLSVLVHEAFEDLDVNEDHEVSKFEFLSIHHPNASERMESYFERKLDVDGNGILSLDEISAWVEPLGFIPAKSEVIYLMEKLDNNRNRQLSKEEVLNYPHIFINSQITFFEDIYRFDKLRHQVFRYELN